MKLCQKYFSYGTDLHNALQQREAWFIFMKFAFTKTGNFLAILSVNRFTPRVQWMMSLIFKFVMNFFVTIQMKPLWQQLRRELFVFQLYSKWNLKVCYNFGSEGQIKVGYFSEFFSPWSESYKPEPCTLTTLAVRKTAFWCKETQKRTYSHDGPF